MALITHDEHCGRVAVVHAVRYPYREHQSGAGLSIYGLTDTHVAGVRVQRQRRAIVAVIVVAADHRVGQRRVQVGVGGFQRGDQRPDRYFLGYLVLDRTGRPHRSVVVFVQNVHFHLLREKKQTNKQITITRTR